MTDAPRTMELAPADWRQLVLLNVEQLGNYIASIPANTEAGLSALTAEHIVVIGSHLERGHQFLTAWSKSRVPGMGQVRAKSATEMIEGAERIMEGEIAEGLRNGAERQKRKGGWPLGKPRKPKAEAGAKQ